MNGRGDLYLWDALYPLARSDNAQQGFCLNDPTTPKSPEQPLPELDDLFGLGAEEPSHMTIDPHTRGEQMPGHQFPEEDMQRYASSSSESYDDSTGEGSFGASFASSSGSESPMAASPLPRLTYPSPMLPQPLESVDVPMEDAQQQMTHAVALHGGSFVTLPVSDLSHAKHTQCNAHVESKASHESHASHYPQLGIRPTIRKQKQQQQLPKEGRRAPKAPNGNGTRPRRQRIRIRDKKTACRLCRAEVTAENWFERRHACQHLEKPAKRWSCLCGEQFSRKDSAKRHVDAKKDPSCHTLHEDRPADADAVDEMMVQCFGHQ